MMWPMNFHLRLRTSSLRFSISAIIRTSLFVILSCQRILNIRLRHLLWKTSILFSSLLFIFHVSQPYIKTGFTSVLYSLLRVFKVSVIYFVLRGWVIGSPPNPQPGGPGAVLCLASSTNPVWLDLPGTRVRAGTALRVIETPKPHHHYKVTAQGQETAVM